MTDFKPDALGITGLDSLLTSPSQAYMDSAIAQRNPWIMAPYVYADTKRRQDYVDKAFSENASVNTMLNELAQQQMTTDLEKKRIDLGRTAMGQLPKSSKSLLPTILSEYGIFGDDPTAALESLIGSDTMEAQGNVADIYSKTTSADAKMLAAQAAMKRAEKAGSGSTGKARWTYELGADGRIIKRQVTTGEPITGDMGEVDPMISSLMGDNNSVAPITKPEGDNVFDLPDGGYAVVQDGMIYQYDATGNEIQAIPMDDSQ